MRSRDFNPPLAMLKWNCPRMRRNSEIARWLWGTGIASARSPFQNLQSRATIGLFLLPKTALKLAENGQMKGNSGYGTHAAPLPCRRAVKGPLPPQYVREPPPNSPQKP